MTNCITYVENSSQKSPKSELQSFLMRWLKDCLRAKIRALDPKTFRIPKVWTARCELSGDQLGSRLGSSKK